MISSQDSTFVVYAIYLRWHMRSFCYLPKIAHIRGLSFQSKIAHSWFMLSVEDSTFMVYIYHCKYQRYILTRCSVNLLVVFNTMVLKRVFFVIINTCVALI